MSNFFTSPYICPNKTDNLSTTLYIAIDVGSTETRSIEFTKDANCGEPLNLDSNFVILNQDIDHIASPNNTVLANMEMQITDLTANNKVNPYFSTIHIVKGDLVKSLTTAQQMTASSVSKIDQQATYINIVSNVALSLLARRTVNGVMNNMPKICLSVALPPEDTRIKSRLEVFKSRLAGRYEVVFPRLNTTITFELTDNFNIISEPEAVAILQTADGKLEGEEDSVVCILDIGGRSTGITFINNGQLMSTSCVTIPIGGSKLLDLFSRNIATALDIQEPPVSRLVTALSTGYFKLGAQKINVIAPLNKAKQEFAEHIFGELIRAVDMNNIQLQSISKVFCSGHTFGTVENESPSLMGHIEKMFKEKSVYTEFERIVNDSPIRDGLVYHGVLYA